MATTNPSILERLLTARLPKPRKDDKGINKRSPSLKEAFKGYVKQVKIFLSKPENLWCAIKAKGCKGLATCVHHTSGRTGAQLKNEADWMPVCESCNSFVEENDSWARENGFKKSRMGKVKK